MAIRIWHFYQIATNKHDIVGREFGKYNPVSPPDTKAKISFNDINGNPLYIQQWEDPPNSGNYLDHVLGYVEFIVVPGEVQMTARVLWDQNVPFVPAVVNPVNLTSLIKQPDGTFLPGGTIVEVEITVTNDPGGFPPDYPGDSHLMPVFLMV